MRLSCSYLSFIILLILCSCKQNTTKNTNDISAIGTEEDTTVGVASAQPVSSPGPLYGIDISKFQGNEVELLDKQKDSLSFIICKATEGITYTDRDFRSNWRLIEEKGFIRGAYHFYRSNDDPTKQADAFSHTIRDLKKTNLPPIVDFEGGGIDRSQSIEEIQTNLLAFLKKVESTLKRKPMIYTDIDSGNKYLNETVFAQYPLWIAVYNGKAKPDLPLAWKDTEWLFWQKTSDYKIGSTKNDFDLFNGNLEVLQQFIKNQNN